MTVDSEPAADQQDDRTIHPSHMPEPEDAPRLYRGGRACMRCCRFVSFDNPYRITDSRVAPCTPVRIGLRQKPTSDLRRRGKERPC